MECWEVDHGDILVGFTHPHVVDSILTDGTFWYFGDDHGTIIAKRRCGSRIQVIRDPKVDDCPVHGIERPVRHLAAVR